MRVKILCYEVPKNKMERPSVAFDHHPLILTSKVLGPLGVPFSLYSDTSANDNSFRNHIR